MHKPDPISNLASTVIFAAVVAFLLSAVLFALMREWRAYCREQCAWVDYFDCENWGWDCEDIA